MQIQNQDIRAKKNKQASSPLNCGPITQKDLARLADVSLSTVYNFLYSKKTICPETRERIDRVIAEYDYQPNGVARAMVRGKTQVIGVLIPRFDILYYSEILAAMESSFNVGGYNCIVCQHLDDSNKEGREIAMLRERRVDGMVIRASSHAKDPEIYRKLERAQIPYVLIDRQIQGLEHRFIGTDGKLSTRELMEFLIRRGHRKIAVALWPEQDQSLGTKFDAYKEVLNQHGIMYDARYVISVSDEYFGGRVETLEMLKRVGDDKPTAIISLNDTTIVGIVEALTESGIKIPEDIAIANIGGYAERSLRALSRFRLTSSVQPCEAIGREAARMLLSQIDGRALPNGPILCPSQLRIGNSA